MSARRAAVGRFKGIAFPDRALPLYEMLVHNAPEWEGAPEAQYRLGTLYQQTKDHLSAVHAFETLRYRYPGAPQIEDADFRRAQCLHALARSRPRDETTCRDAISALAAFLVEYPDSENAAAAREMLDAQKEHLAGMYYVRAVFYDRHRKRKPRAALIAYEDFIAKFPTSPLADRARTRLKFLRENLEIPEEK
jgi:outer membrane protein assembly factor BamD (BamD/ComL family)